METVLTTLLAAALVAGLVLVFIGMPIVVMFILVMRVIEQFAASPHEH